MEHASSGMGEIQTLRIEDILKGAGKAAPTKLVFSKDDGASSGAAGEISTPLLRACMHACPRMEAHAPHASVSGSVAPCTHACMHSHAHACMHGPHRQPLCSAVASACQAMLLTSIPNAPVLPEGVGRAQLEWANWARASASIANAQRFYQKRPDFKDG
jgi:hypothetical protein